MPNGLRPSLEFEDDPLARRVRAIRAAQDPHGLADLPGTTPPEVGSPVELAREATRAESAGARGKASAAEDAKQFRRNLAIGLATLADIAGSFKAARGGERGPSSLKQMLEQEQQEELMGLRREAAGREERASARAEAGFQLQVEDTLLNRASVLAPRLNQLEPAEGARLKGQIIEEATQRAPSIVPLIQAAFSDVQFGGAIGSYLEFLGPRASGLKPTLNALVVANKPDEALNLVRAHVQTQVTNEFRDRLRSLATPGLRARYPDGIPQEVVEGAFSGPRDVALLEFLRGVGVFAKSQDYVKSALETYGFEIPGLAVKAKEAGTVARATAEGKPTEGPPLGTDEKTILAGAGLKVETLDPTNPVHAAAIKAARAQAQKEKGEVAELTGAAAARGKLAVPERASPAEREKLVDEMAAFDRLTDLGTLYRPEFVGPARGRAATVEEATGLAIAGVTPEESQFRSSVRNLQNLTIKLITGAQLSKEEASRIMGQLPAFENPSSVFEARLKQTFTNIRFMAERRRDILKKTGVDITDLPEIPKAPPRLGSRSSSPSPAQRLSDEELKKKLGIR